MLINYQNIKGFQNESNTGLYGLALTLNMPMLMKIHGMKFTFSYKCRLCHHSRFSDLCIQISVIPTMLNKELHYNNKDHPHLPIIHNQMNLTRL